MPPWLMVVLTGVAAAVLAVGARATEGYFVPPNSHSMEPTMYPGDRFRADVAWAPQHGPRRGEIWVLHNPRPKNHNGPLLIKRVIAVPGDTLEVSHGQVLLNHETLNEPYWTQPLKKSLAARKLGPNQYFVMGDNRNNSSDSMEFGPLPRGAFVGHVLMRYWPLRRFGWM